VVIPKSVTPARIGENLRAAGVTLSEADLAAIDGLDRGERYAPDPLTYV
jgi:2,5-diketo-D-gluconate reductase A